MKQLEADLNDSLERFKNQSSSSEDELQNAKLEETKNLLIDENTKLRHNEKDLNKTINKL
jgi:hypothetical protein